MKKSKKNREGVVYSTIPNFEYNHFSALQQELADKNKQPLRVAVDYKGRKGKIATVITGFQGPDQDLQDLAKELKTKCGVGGSAKNGEIIIQGNQIDKVMDYLLKEGYSAAKKSGGTRK